MFSFTCLLANDNRYEGEWRADKKHGRGKFFYVTRGQLMEGLWIDDVCKTSEMKDFGRDQAILPTPYPLPGVEIFLKHSFSSLVFSSFLSFFQLTLANPEQVLAEAQSTIIAND